jgi:YD repeat-containing protein
LVDRAGNRDVLGTHAAGTVLQVPNPDGYTLEFAYDPNNNVLGAADQAGNTASTTRDLSGKPRTVIDPNGNTVTTVYYGAERDGRVKQRIDALGRITQWPRGT